MLKVKKSQKYILTVIFRENPEVYKEKELKYSVEKNTKFKLSKCQQNLLTVLHGMAYSDILVELWGFPFQLKFLQVHLRLNYCYYYLRLGSMKIIEHWRGMQATAHELACSRFEPWLGRSKPRMRRD